MILATNWNSILWDGIRQEPLKQVQTIHTTEVQDLSERREIT